MGRKSKKVAAGSARGFATASTPAKQPSREQSHDQSHDQVSKNEQETSRASSHSKDLRKPNKPLPEQPEPETGNTPRRFNPLNDYKAKAAFKALQHVDPDEINGRVRSFALSSHLEESLVQIFQKREQEGTHRIVRLSLLGQPRCSHCFCLPAMQARSNH